MDHVLEPELLRGLDHIRAAPTGSGTVELIVRRPGEDQREVLDSGELTVEEGLVGDDWANRTDPDSGYVENQVTVMNARYADLIARGRDSWPLAGDQFYVDLDISIDHLPPGSRVKIGDAVLEISAQPHTGCAKFRARFGLDALRLANSKEGRRLRLRGVNARVVQPGVVGSGDTIEKL